MIDWAAGDGPLLVRDDGPVRRFVLNRPTAGNAIDQTLTDALAAALDDFEARDDLRVGLVCGNGKHFSAGMDLREFLATGIPTGTGGFAGIVERHARKPLVAAVHGAVLAGGLEIALACDLIVASGTARFGLPEVSVGLVAAAGGLIRLPRRVPYGVAARAALTGEPFDAGTAYRLGLVGDLAEDDAALPGLADALVRRIAANAPLAVAASRQVLHDSYGVGVDQAFAAQRAVTDPVFASDDAREGAASFTERRPPVWHGR